jgi:hypothetical protein
MQRLSLNRSEVHPDSVQPPVILHQLEQPVHKSAQNVVNHQTTTPVYLSYIDF